MEQKLAPETQKPVVIYVRVSTEEQKEGFSIAAQLELLLDYAKKNDFKVVRVFEESQSAKVSGRLQFTKMLKYLDSHRDVNTILVEKTDRLYRNFKDYATIDDKGYELHLVKENEVLCKNSTSHQMLVHGLKVLLAKNFIDNLREETRKGRKKKAEEGYFNGPAPYGYVKVNKNESIIVPEQAEYLKRAFTLASEGMSLRDISAKLRMDGYIYRPKTPICSHGHLYHILQNPSYCGKIIFEDRLFDAKHEPIISQELFDKVQEQLQRQTNGNQFIFQSLIKCDRCGATITAEMKKGRYIYYHCTGGRSRRCRQKEIQVHEQTLFNQILKQIKRVKISPSIMKYIVLTVNKEMKDIQFIDTSVREELTAEKEQLQKFLDAMYMDKLAGKVPEHLFEQKEKEFSTRLKEIDETLAGASSSLSGVDEEACLKLLERINNLDQLFKYGGFTAQRNIVQMMFKEIYLKGRLITCTFKEPFNYFIQPEQQDGKSLLEMAEERP